MAAVSCRGIRVNEVAREGNPALNVDRIVKEGR